MLSPDGGALKSFVRDSQTTNDLRAMPGRGDTCKAKTGKTHSFCLGKVIENMEQEVQ